MKGIQTYAPEECPCQVKQVRKNEETYEIHCLQCGKQQR